MKFEPIIIKWNYDKPSVRAKFSNVDFELNVDYSSDQAKDGQSIDFEWNSTKHRIQLKVYIKYMYCVHKSLVWVEYVDKSSSKDRDK